MLYLCSKWLPVRTVLIHLSLKVATVSRGHSWDRCASPSTTAPVSNKKHWLINQGQAELCLEKIETHRGGVGGVDQKAMSGF